MPSEGPVAIRFIEQHCRHPRGDRAGQLIKLEPFQADLLADLLDLGPDGRRHYRQAYIQTPRKNGKTLVTACLATYAAVVDEPGGEVYFVAGDRQQASRAFIECRTIVESDPELRSLFKVYRNHMEIPSTGTILRVLSSEAGLQQGLSPSFVVFDEVAVQPDERLWTAMTQGSGTRSNALVVGISTPGWSKDSLAWRLYEHGKAIQRGETGDPTFFFRCYEPSDPDCDWRDPTTWREANPALGSFLLAEDFEAMVRVTPEHEFRRFRLGMWTETQAAAFPFGAWEACADPEREVAHGAEVVLGLDPSFSRDATALIGATVDERPHIFVGEIWEQPAGDPTWRVPIVDVLAAIRQACQRFVVREVAFDPYRTWSETMAALQDDGITVTEWSTNSPARIGPPWMAFHDAVMEQRLTHDGDARLARHIANLVIKSDRLGPRPIHDRSSPRAYQDGAIAAIIAHDRATHQEPPLTPFVMWGS